jgi:hypothetical protein
VTKRYTAIVEIVEVEEIAENKDRYNPTPARKDSKELTKLVVRDETLEGLKTKLGKHIELV